MLPLFRLPSRTRLVLASGSPRRRQFLEEWGLPFTILQASQEEPRPYPSEPPADYVCRAARFKAEAVLDAMNLQDDSRCLLIAADTIVAVNGRMLGKPAHAAEALDMLKLLSGKTHEVISGVHVAAFSGQDMCFQHTFSEQTCVTFHDWSEQVLRAYVATGEPLDKAGGYAIQGQGAFLVDSVKGSWSTVVGLPVSTLAAYLLQRNWLYCAS